MWHFFLSYAVPVPPPSAPRLVYAIKEHVAPCGGHVKQYVDEDHGLGEGPQERLEGFDRSFRGSQGTYG